MLLITQIMANLGKLIPRVLVLSLAILYVFVRHLSKSRQSRFASCIILGPTS